MDAIEHEAMATRFVLEVADSDSAAIHSVLGQACQLMDELELTLSRFVPDSDISRINDLKEGNSVLIENESWEVLKKSIRVMLWTSGAFDVGVGKYMDIFRAGKQGLLNDKEVIHALQKVREEKENASIYVDPDEPRVYKIKQGMYLDLGGIGKGFALNEMSEYLVRQEVKAFKLNAGDSTVLVRSTEDQSWPFSLAATNDEVQVEIMNTSVSASGTYWQGQHIFDPRTGTNSFQPLYDRLWVCADDPAYSDALSTAFFLMTEPEILDVWQEIDGLRWVAYAKEGKIKMLEPNS
ncbi:hypothetical protein FNH22_04990 [Fulvivirga sp. M361]|uniref:FAD:protein FMN transferase n=1 Tax=Fulvivirga sp. M361 TaxID=2594266 RepID=UPI001179A840|nr:FAD:protein FMN transferase [Fulvivirga sp. M361]TRX61414.1 hypothetical protein FNH22_04990 [Fulvivirga sp. M361]